MEFSYLLSVHTAQPVQLYSCAGLVSLLRAGEAQLLFDHGCRLEQKSREPVKDRVLLLIHKCVCDSAEELGLRIEEKCSCFCLLQPVVHKAAVCTYVLLQELLQHTMNATLVHC